MQQRHWRSAHENWTAFSHWLWNSELLSTRVPGEVPQYDDDRDLTERQEEEIEDDPDEIEFVELHDFSYVNMGKW